VICEKCWDDAYWRAKTDPSKVQAEHYQDLLKERDSHQGTSKPLPAPPTKEKPDVLR